MYYTLLELRVLPKTEGAYHALSDHTARWRESNVLPRDCFADNTRDTIQDFDDYFESIDDYLGRGIYHLQYAKDNYSIPRWHNQSNYVEVWLEKDAAVGTFRSIVKDRHIRVVPNRGHSSVAFLDKNVDRLKEKQLEGKHIHILYFGDADPSGEVMDKVYKRKLLEYGLYNVKFIRLAVTKEQIDRFGLLHNPDPLTLSKLKKDPNRRAFKTKYGLKSDDELFTVQLEAMQAPSVRNELKTLVLSNIDALFNDVYEQIQAAKPSLREINAHIRTLALELLDTLEGEDSS